MRFYLAIVPGTGFYRIHYGRWSLFFKSCHYFDVIDVCKENNIKTIITLHDFYCICPTINLLYKMEKYCMNIEPAKKDCASCLYNKMRIANNIGNRLNINNNM